MIYYNENGILIRDMLESDIQAITDAEVAQGWHQTTEVYEIRFKDQNEGRCIALYAEFNGEPAGYIHVYPNSQWGAFAGKGLPEIVDFGVLEKFRRNGIGSKLMDVAEEVAARYADTVYLGVGLHYGYGSAQRMYTKRGYILDGTGVWYGDHVLEQYEDTCNDDDLNLYFTKKLR